MAKIDIEKLKNGLKSVTGNDLQQAEIKMRNKGDLISMVVSGSTIFQAELAAQVLGVPSSEITNLPAGEYQLVTQTVRDFLVSTLAETIQPMPSEK